MLNTKALLTVFAIALIQSTALCQNPLDELEKRLNEPSIEMTEAKGKFAYKVPPGYFPKEDEQTKLTNVYLRTTDGNVLVGIEFVIIPWKEDLNKFKNEFLNLRGKKEGVNIEGLEKMQTDSGVNGFVVVESEKGSSDRSVSFILKRPREESVLWVYTAMRDQRYEPVVKKVFKTFRFLD